MKDFIAEDDQPLLTQEGLASFEALWSLQLDAVDATNSGRGGWSSVYRLDLGGLGYYLKRQSNHLTRTLLHPFGEPTFAREMRNIHRYQRLGIPALRAAFFAMRRVAGKQCAVLLTRALDGWRDLDSYLPAWSSMVEAEHLAILASIGSLARKLHGARQMHGCFYPKHIFLREQEDGSYEACLIDLEKTRPLILSRRDRVKDLETLLRRAHIWSEMDIRHFLLAYLGDSAHVDTWLHELQRRRYNKEAR